MSEVLFCAKDLSQQYKIHPGHASRRIRKLVKEGKAEFAFRDNGTKMFRWKTPDKKITTNPNNARQQRGGFTPRTQVTQIAPSPTPPAPAVQDDGYIYLKEGDIIEKGDEYSPKGDTWCLSERVGNKAIAGMKYRRKKPVAAPAPCTRNPGEGYRLLGPEETIEAGDEGNALSNDWESGGGWLDADRLGRVGQKVKSTGYVLGFRRKVTSTKGLYYLAGPIDLDDETAKILIARNYPVSQRAW